MKKTYIRPITYTVNIMIKANLMEVSQFSMDVNGSNGDAESASYSRGGSFWDDEY